VRRSRLAGVGHSIHRERLGVVVQEVLDRLDVPL
jgi:hypothetical protein